MSFHGDKRRQRARLFVDAMAESLTRLRAFAARDTDNVGYVANRRAHRAFVHRLDEVISLGLLAEVELSALPDDAGRERIAANLGRLKGALLETAAKVLLQQLSAWTAWVERGYHPPIGAYEELERTGAVIAHAEMALAGDAALVDPEAARTMASAGETAKRLMSMSPRLPDWGSDRAA